VLIINYGIIIKSVSTLMYTVWHVDKYKITFKLVIITGLMKFWSLTFATQMLLRRSGSELIDTFKNIILLRIFPL
jgi:hypothetical protein